MQLDVVDGAHVQFPRTSQSLFHFGCSDECDEGMDIDVEC